MPIAHLALGAAHHEAGNSDAARDSLLRVLAAAPGAPRERAEAHYRLAGLADSTDTGTAASGSGSRESRRGAEAHLREAIGIDNDFAEAHALLGRLLGRREAYAEAASHFARALSRDPANARWHGDRAMALILGKRYQAAQGALRSSRSAVLRAGDAPAEALDHLNTLLARLLAAGPAPELRNGREALTIARGLMAERPTLRHAETLAMAFAEVGDFNRAASLQSQVLAEMRRRGNEPTGGQKQRLQSFLNEKPVREPWFLP